MADKSPPITASLGFGLAPSQQPNTAPQRKARILIVDGDPESRRFLKNRLTSPEYAVEFAYDAEAALESCVRARPNLVISDLHLKSMDGLGLLKELKSRWPEITVIIVTAHGTIPDAVRATQCGAFGFLVKPIEKAELLEQVDRALAMSNFTRADGDWRADIVTRSQLMEDRLGLANRAAGSDASVLLTGENGTGKELMARAIHAASPRRDRPFVAVYCNDADEAELAVLLFGYSSKTVNDEAPQHTMGAIDGARGGTLLLDEIGGLAPRLQISLMAALGGATSRDRSEDGRAPPARLICTTSRDLRQLMQAGEFRQDLYYHVAVLPIEIPPLGRRREDIPLLISHFLEQASDGGAGTKLYTPEAIELLATTDWPGNVRQLFELVKQNVALSHGKIMSKEFVARSLGRAVPKVPSYNEARDTFARRYLSDNLHSTAGNVSEAARLAKRNRTDFYKLLARYRLQPDDFKKEADAKKPAADD